MSIHVGDRLHGYCGGYFGRDHYTCGTVEAVGLDWIVLRCDDYGKPHVAVTSGHDIHTQMLEYRQNDPAQPCPFYADDGHCSFRAG